MKALFLPALLSAMFWTNTVMAATYYINDAQSGSETWCSAAGNDGTGNGSAGAPYATFNKVVTDHTLGQGDTVRIDHGTYSWGSNPAISPDGSGVSGDEIVIEGAGQASTSITGTSGYSINTNDHDYLIFRNFTLANSNFNSPIFVKSGSTNCQFNNITCTHNDHQAIIDFEDGSTNNSHTVSGCTLTTGSSSEPTIKIGTSTTDITVTGCTLSGSSDRTLFTEGACSDVVISNNTINNSNNFGFAVYLNTGHDNITVDGNTINGTGTDTDGIWVLGDGTTAATITDNTIELTGSNGSAYGILFQNGQDSPNVKRNKFIGGDFGIFVQPSAMTKLSIYNNSFSNCDNGIHINSNSWGVDIYNNSFYVNNNCIENSQLGGTNIKNNIFYTTSNSSSDYCIEASSDPATCDNNLFYHPNAAQAGYSGGAAKADLATWNTDTGFDGNGVEGDPLYWGAADDNLSVDLSSPGADAGESSLVTLDILEATRSDPPYIGAYEADEGSILPVEFGTFTGTVTAHVVLQWQTLSEVNNDVFEVHWSNNGQDFQVIGTADGQGTTSQTQDYSFTDYDHDQGYYQLVQIDFDSRASYSEVIFVSKSGSKKMNFSPQMDIKSSATGLLEVNINSRSNQQLSFELLDGLGRMITTSIITSSSSTAFIDVNQFRNQFVVARLTGTTGSVAKKLWINY